MIFMPTIIALDIAQATIEDRENWRLPDYSDAFLELPLGKNVGHNRPYGILLAIIAKEIEVLL